MVADNDLKKYGELFNEIHKEQGNEEKGSRTVELFFSFDIVNSSSYKDVNFYGWQEVLISLLTLLQRNVAKEIPEAQLWRVLGDEVIFFVTISDIDEIYQSVDSIYAVLVNANRTLKDGSFFETLDKRQRGVGTLKCNNILAVQSAAWLAIVSNGKEDDFQPYDNIFKKYENSNGQSINEFLGQDIDIGFRIKKKTQDRRLTVSLELAKILSDKTEYLSRLHIITYKSLKGVWKDRLYPIIWYHDEIISGENFEDSFYYDEIFYSQLSKEYFNNRKENRTDGLPVSMFNDVRSALMKIVKDQRMEEKIGKICDVIENTGKDVRAVEKEFDNKVLEFHCAAVCCNTDDRTILIVKRRKDRQQLPGLWEFGCAKANVGQSLCDSIIQDYKSDFGIDIEVICDDNREDAQPKPIALYQIEKNTITKKIQKGVIVIAKVKGNYTNIQSEIKGKGKHEEARWISKNEIDKFNEPAINDFQDTLKKVFELWDKLFEEK